MKPRHVAFAALLLSLGLTGCKQETGSYQLDNARSFTLQRTKNFLWSKEWERWLTVSRMPDCQRKHPLDNESDFEDLKLRQLDEDRIQIEDGDTLYLADLATCTLTEQKKGTAKEGTPLGEFSTPANQRIPFEPAKPKTPAK